MEAILTVEMKELLELLDRGELGQNCARTRSERAITVQFDERLLDYIKSGQAAQFKLMMNENLVDRFDGYGTLLHYAARYGDASIVRHLISMGSEVDSLGENNETPLMLATQAGHTGAIQVLLEANADVDIANARGRSALRMAFEPDSSSSSHVGAFVLRLQRLSRTSEELAERLASAGGNIFHATYSQDAQLMARMLERNIGVNSTGCRARTALHRAAELDDLNRAGWLIDNGADVNARDVHGYTALLISASKISKHMVKYLLEQGADPNCKRRRDYTPLSAVFANAGQGSGLDSVECVVLLLRYGAVLDDFNTGRYTAFHGSSWLTDNTMTLLISQLTVLDASASIAESFVCRVADQWQWLDLARFISTYELCMQTLGIVAFGKLSLLDVLKADEHTVRTLARNEAFLAKLDDICSEHKLSQLYSYYYETLMGRIDKARRLLKLEAGAIRVICQMFNGNFNQCYQFARKVASYLDQRDFEHLIQVS